jgi:hypothetical protein
MARHLRKIFFLVLSPCLAACQQMGREDDEARGFYLRPAAEWPSALRRFPLPRQYELFLYGVREVHPPPLGLASVIARQGEPAVRLTASRLRATRDPLEATYALLILQEAATNGESPCKNPAVEESVRMGRRNLRGSAYEAEYNRMQDSFCPSPID